MQQRNNQFYGYLNSDYIDSLYQDYLRDPQSVMPQWRSFFESLPSDPQPSLNLNSNVSLEHELKQIQVLRLIQAYRLQGYLHAQVNPLGYTALPHVSKTELSLEDHKLSVKDLATVFDAETFLGPKRLPLGELYQALIEAYCGSIGAEFMHIPVLEEREWIQLQIESIRRLPPLNQELQRKILTQLLMAEGLERYLGSKFPGAKRFSLEGGEALVVCLDQLIQRSGEKNVKTMVIGMAHRGRLNVLVNILGKNPNDLFEEFAGKKVANSASGESGDVKYHQGFSSDIKINHHAVHVALAFNPSHLEVVTPVVLGSVLARQRSFPDPNFNDVVPIAIHGDASFAGQGVVMETLNMSQTRAYGVGGTLHIIINNQIGFTTSAPEDARSTLYCSDVAKIILAPIFHVNADDPEAVYYVTQLALDYRMKFNKDVIIDLVCYRRHGHNEADEPRATQPLMYQTIEKHPTVCSIYAAQLLKENRITQDEVSYLNNQVRENLDKGKSVAPNVVSEAKSDQMISNKLYTASDFNTPINTGLEKTVFDQVAKALVQIPDHFVLNPRVAKIMEDRHKMALGKLPIDWGFAEMMAYASLLVQGVSLRLTGQDVRRGTFFHRHAILHDQKTGEEYSVLEHIAQKTHKSTTQIYDSLLSEEAVLAFEYGYATVDSKSLVIWEAQFGDFANGAQVVIDQFISSGTQKWGRLCGLVMLLPHGYEGQGPEHSSARLERYLQLCAEYNLQICIPSTAAQVFHMIRRQILRSVRVPLIVMSPKSLLRHKDVACDIAEFLEGSFQLLIGDKTKIEPQQVNKVILCSGKVYYDLLEKRNQDKIENLPIIRIEQLYPFPELDLKAEFKKYPNLKKVIWCQEEPQNQGAWYASQHHMRACLENDQILEYAGRAPSAAPAVGYYPIHVLQQEALVNQALTL